MAFVERPDGARIYYECHGAGYPLLLLAPGGINSQVSLWESSAINPFKFSDEFMVIGMNQRHAESSPAPLSAPTWAIHASDQRAVLDALGVQRTLLWGGCIGVPFALRFVQEAPERVAGAVGQDPVGLRPGVNTRETFSEMFKPTIDAARMSGMSAVVDHAMRDPLFVRNNAAGPFAARISADRSFRDELLALDPGDYEDIVREYDDNIWGAVPPFFGVDEAFVRACPASLLILPGRDQFHPTEVSEQICREAPKASCLPVDCREPQNIEETTSIVRRFLHQCST
ncbi:MAG: alpha/beta hydrolase [Dehalococcoidia bacterium]